MNIHHLELFYYVAKHGGISPAVRAIPYGIQQPAVSGQIARLEETLGTPLFRRRPFTLTPAGEELFRFITPFFDGVAEVGDKIRAANALPQLRIAAPSAVLHEELPELLRRLRARFPVFRLNLHEASQADAERLLEAREVDVAITVLETKPARRLCSRPLVELPLALLLPSDSPIRSPEDLWRRDRIEETLITFPPTEPAAALFQKELDRRGVEWFGRIEVNALKLIECYVENGFGIGLGVLLPGPVKKKGKIRPLPLEDFPKLTLGALWSEPLAPIAAAFLEEAQKSVVALRLP